MPATVEEARRLAEAVDGGAPPSSPVAPWNEPFVAHLGAHLGGFLQIQVTLPPSTPALVTGHHGERYQAGWRALVAATRPGDAEAVLAWERQAAAVGVAQWGLKWPIDATAPLQLYLIGRFVPSVVADLQATLGADATALRDGAELVAQLLEASGKADIYMVGVELPWTIQATKRRRQVVYVTMPCEPSSVAQARTAIGALLARRVGERWASRWPAVAHRVLRDDRVQTLFISAELGVGAPAPLKVDVGGMHVLEVMPVAATLGLPPQAVRAAESAATTLGALRAEHAGFSFAPDGSARVSLYHRWVRPGPAA